MLLQIKNCIAEIFNDFFVNVSSNLASKIPKRKGPFNTYLRKCFKLIFR